MKRYICNCCEKEIKYKPIYHINVREETYGSHCASQKEYALCEECYKKVFNIKEE